MTEGRRVTKAQAERLGLRLDDPVALNEEVRKVLATLLDVDTNLSWGDVVHRIATKARWPERYVQSLSESDGDATLELALRLIELRTFA